MASPSSERPHAIEARNLVKTYPGGVRALDGITLAVEEGTVFGLLGPNGAGKSTTVKILTTLSRPNEGEPLVAGLNALEHPDEVRRTIGLVAQASGLDPEATARENLRLQGQICRPSPTSTRSTGRSRRVGRSRSGPPTGRSCSRGRAS
jgi:ABC-2 type transport system ATP-binding protein